MSTVSYYVPGPYEGVSQVPPQDRLQGACEDMRDCLGMLPLGVQKRPPWEFQGVFPSVSANAFFGIIPRGSPDTDCFLVISGSHVYVRRLAAPTVDLTVTVTPAALTYLLHGSPVPSRDYRVCTIEDFTFLTNQLQSTALLGTTSPTRPHEAVIWVKAGEYARTYTVTVSPSGGTPVSASYQPSTGGTAQDAYGVGTDRIAQGLYDGTIPVSPVDGHTSGATVAGSPLNTLVGQGFTVTLNGSLITLTHPSVDFTVVTNDDQGSTAMVGVKGVVQRFSDLPAVGPDGFTVRIAQEAAGGDSDYYVKFNVNVAPAGYWQECIAPGTNLGLDPVTLPLGLTTTDGLAWTLDVCAWKGRQTGTALLSPDPGFLGSPITDVNWYNGRLELLYPGGAVLSDSSSPFNFYKTTLAASLDSDPIGLLPPQGRKAFFKRAGAFDQRNVLFGDLTQGVVGVINAVPTPTSTQISLMAASPFSDLFPLQYANHKLYFPAIRGDFLVVYELRIDRLSGQALEEPVTKAVPRLLPAATDRADTYAGEYVTVYGQSGSGTLYAHVHQEAKQEAVQNSWQPWGLPPGYVLAGLAFRSSVLYALTRAPNSSGCLLSLNVAPGIQEPAGYLDLRVTEAACTVTYDAVLNRTTYTPPWDPPARDTPTIVQRQTTADAPYGYRWPAPPGMIPSGYSVQGDLRGKPVWVGLTYKSYFVPTQHFVLGVQDQKPQLYGRLSVRAYKLDIADYGTVSVQVNVQGAAPHVTTYDAPYVDDADYSGLDVALLKETVALRVPIGARSDAYKAVIYNESHLGFKVMGYEWSADWNPRTRRVT